jgi:hypothetical protein
VRASISFRAGIRGRVREWNWHNVLGIWCALPLLVIVLTGVVMSFDWANVLLLRLTGSTPPRSVVMSAKRRSHGGEMRAGAERNYDYLLPQKRTQYSSNRETGAVVKISAFASGSLGQRLRTFVRFGHTGEYGGWLGQVIAALASLGTCVLVATGPRNVAAQTCGQSEAQKSRVTARNLLRTGSWLNWVTRNRRLFWEQLAQPNALAIVILQPSEISAYLCLVRLVQSSIAGNQFRIQRGPATLPFDRRPFGRGRIAMTFDEFNLGLLVALRFGARLPVCGGYVVIVKPAVESNDCPGTELC